MYTTIIDCFKALTTELYARVESVGYLELELEDKVTVVFLRTKEGVGRSQLGLAHYSPVFHLVSSFAVQLMPAFEVFTVEERFPVLTHNGHGHQTGQGQGDKIFHLG